MNEQPTYQPLPELPPYRHFIGVEDLGDIVIDHEDIDRAAALMTPAWLLEQTEFPQPNVIIPKWFPTFADIRAEREAIRHLQLVPVKDDEQYAFYHAQPKDYIMRLVDRYISYSSMTLAVNRYPYYLPEDVGQYLIWLHDAATAYDTAAIYLAKAIKLFGVTDDDVIIFERSMKTQSKLARGTIPEVRHIHFWVDLNKAIWTPKGSLAMQDAH